MEQDGIAELRVGLLLLMAAGAVGAYPHREALAKIAPSNLLLGIAFGLLPILIMFAAIAFSSHKGRAGSDFESGPSRR